MVFYKTQNASKRTYQSHVRGRPIILIQTSVKNDEPRSRTLFRFYLEVVNDSRVIVAIDQKIARNDAAIF